MGIDKKERFGNRRDAFSHSPQCDEYFSKISDLPGGDPHPAHCACWCHKVDLEENIPVEYDGENYG